MSILGWIVFGAITGWLASLIVSSRGQGCIVNIALGLVGSVVGGAIFRALTNEDVINGFNLKSIVIAIIGAVGVLLLWHAIAGRRRPL